METTNPKSNDSADAATKDGIAVVVIRQSESIVIAHGSDKRISANIPFGSKIIYDALQLVFNVSAGDLLEKYAWENFSGGLNTNSELTTEQEKRVSESERAFPELTIEGIIRRHLQDILTYAYFAIKNHGLEKKISNRLIITGDFSNFPDLKTIGELATGFDCEVCTWNHSDKL